MNPAQNLKFAARLLRRNPALAGSAILVTALGIGATSAMFSVADGILLRPLPFPRAERLVNVWESAPGHNLPSLVAAPGNYFDWRAQSRSFRAMGAWQAATFNLASRDSEPERYSGAICDAGFFGVLGVQPEIGRVSTMRRRSRARTTWWCWHGRCGSSDSAVTRA